jgi:hypothetical protein
MMAMGSSHSIVPSLATARREGKERRRPNLFGGAKFSIEVRVLRANPDRRVESNAHVRETSSDD